MSENATTYNKILSKGIEADLHDIGVNKLRFTTDTARLFLDNEGTDRIEFTDFVKGMTQEEILGTLAPLPKIYLASDTSAFFYYDNGWKSINSSTAVNASTASFAVEAGHSTNADNATNSSTANYATNAASAETAVNASTASFAVEAGHSTNADNATNASTAEYANYAAAAYSTDYANNANNATNASSAEYAGYAAEAGTAGNATCATNSANADYASTASYAYIADGADHATYATNADNASTAHYAETAGYAAEAGTAGNATCATNAESATNAGTASYAYIADGADHATYATNADNASTAHYAETAGYAAEAGTAGNATCATNSANADYASTAGYALIADGADHATNATNADNASTAHYAETAGYAAEAGTAGNATCATNSANADYASTAGYALIADGADHATNAVNAESATNAGTASYAYIAGSAASATNSSTSEYSVNAGSAGSATTDEYGNHFTVAYALLESPIFTGTPTVPDAPNGSTTSQIANTKFVTNAISTAIGGVTQFDYQIVTTLPDPSAAVKGIIYLISNSGTGDNIYDEYILVDNRLEKIGTTQMNLDGYVNATTVTGTGNAITGVSKNGSTVTFTKNSTFLTEHPAVIHGSSTAAATPSAGGTIDVITNITTDNYGHASSFTKTTVTLPDSVSNATCATNASSVNGKTVATSVPSGAVFTDTKVTSVDNHYAPETNNASSLNKDAAGGSDATPGTTNMVTGITIKRDAKGHVTDMDIKSIKLPTYPTNTDHLYYTDSTLKVVGTSGNNSTFGVNTTYAFNLSNTTVAKADNATCATNASSVNGHTVNTNVPSNAVFSDTTYSFSNGAPTLSWGNTSTVGTVGGVNLTVKMPTNPNTDHQYFAGTGLNAASTSGNNTTFTVDTTYAFNLSAATVAKAGTATTANSATNASTATYATNAASVAASCDFDFGEL